MHECRCTRASTCVVPIGCRSNSHNPSTCSHVYCLLHVLTVTFARSDNGIVPNINTLQFRGGNPVFFFFELSERTSPRSTGLNRCSWGVCGRFFFLVEGFQLLRRTIDSNHVSSPGCREAAEASGRRNASCYERGTSFFGVIFDERRRTTQQPHPLGLTL